VEFRDALVEELAGAESRGEGACADVAVVVAGVGGDDLERCALGMFVDEEAVGLASSGLVVDAHDLIDGQTGVDGVFADEVPVAHPGGAEVAYGAVVGEGLGGG
jgi:hypothetical protein